MAGVIFLLVVLGVVVLVTFWLGIMSIFLGVTAGIGESSWGVFFLGLIGWAILWGGSAWALYGFITNLVSLFS